MAKNYFKSYIWLLETLQSRGPLTLAQLRELWEHSAVNEDGRDLAPRTFANHVAAIADIFGIDITCDRRNNTYYIENDDDLDGNGLRSWMLDRKLKVRYQGYRMEEERTFELEPYFIREFKRRWYLYGHKDYDKDFKPHMYALDRMMEVEVLQDTFKMPADLDAKTWFQSLYGVRKYDDMKSQRVLLKVYGKQVRYFRSLPLHSSQEEVETHRDHSVFAYNLAPDYDFKQDILSFGDTIEVLEPKSLRTSIKETINQLNTYYDDEQ